MQRELQAHRGGYGVQAIALLLVGCGFYGFSLDRYPGYYVDDAFFAFPAWKAAQGGPFTYVVSSTAPYAKEIWAYHGPIFPHLLELLFRVFGFSIAVSRLPDFVGGWLAALLIVLFLNRRGYRYAGLSFAVLWCGDRTPQELMYGRMDGLALLMLVLAFLALERGWRGSSAGAMLACGIFCGLADLVNPLCLSFTVVASLLAAYAMRWRGAGWFGTGCLLNVPVLLLLWHFQVRESVAQFLWHGSLMQKESFRHSVSVLIFVLRWSRFWFVSLVVLCGVCAVMAALRLAKKGRPTEEGEWLFLMASAFGLAGLEGLARASTHPYYIVYFSLWPMLCLCVLAEERWRQVRYIAVAMGLIWCSSAAWNVMRVREAIKFHAQLSRRFLYAEMRRDVPLSAEIEAVPELYSAPIAAGFPHYDLTTWFPESENGCADCYLLMTGSEFLHPQYFAQANLQRRQVLYAGPAFPGAVVPLDSPVVLLSPARPSVN